ncbi:MAG: hypothetical protein R3A79_25480 [Nannocystaceae bacterium]
MANRRRPPSPRLRRRTWLHLAAYALVVAAHFALVQAPGAVLDVARDARLALPDGIALRDVAVLGDGHHALAAVATPEGGAIWLLDWGRIAEVVDGETELAALRLAATASAWVPQQAQGAAGRWRWVEGPSDARVAVRWTPPAAPERAPLPADTLWIGDSGVVERSAVDAQLDAQLDAARPSARRLAYLSGEVALVRRAQRGDPTALGDDLLVADAATGELVDRVDTYALGLVGAGAGGLLFFTHGLHSRLAILDCDRRGCARQRGAPGTGGPTITAATSDPSGELIALCAKDGELRLYSRAADRVRHLVSAAPAGGCAAVVAVDRERVLVRGEAGWRALTLKARGGWLR